jgi:hypothetical protein
VDLGLKKPICKHTPCPEEYVHKANWMERKSKTHTQVKCPVCGLFAVWIPKPKRKEKA